MSDTAATEAPDLDEPAIAPPDDADVESRESGDGSDDITYRRVVNDRTRTLFKTAAKSIADQIADGAGDDEMVAIPPPDTNAPPAAAAAATAPAPAGSQVATPSSAAAAAPVLDVAANRQALELDVRAKALDEREAALVTREKSGTTIDAFRDRYLESPSAALRELVTAWTGAEGDSIKDEVADLITDLSENVLGLPVSPEVKARTDSRRAVRSVKAWKAEQARKDAEAAKARDAERANAEQQAREKLAVDAIDGLLKADGVSAKFPHLMLEDAPHAIVWDVIKAQQRQHVAKGQPADSFVANWEDAAKLADNYFSTQHNKQREKLNRLPTPANKPAAAVAPQGAVQSRTARALTNASTAPVAPVPPVDDDEPYDRDRSRRRSLGKLREHMEKRTT